MKTPKRRPHAALIHAWADGAMIQLKKGNGEWEDCLGNFPAWNEKNEYRIKPEEPSNEPWKPKAEGNYWALDSAGEPFLAKWTGKYDEQRYSFGNCFRTKKQAEAAIPRVKDALKGTTNVSNNVGSKVGSPELDGKPLTHIEKNAIRMFRAGVPFPEAECGTWRALSPGEDALIKALRAAKISDIYPYDAIIVYKEGDGELITDSYLVAFSLAITEGGRSALSKALSATCTALNKIQKEQEAHLMGISKTETPTQNSGGAK